MQTFSSKNLIRIYQAFTVIFNPRFSTLISNPFGPYVHPDPTLVPGYHYQIAKRKGSKLLSIIYGPPHVSKHRRISNLVSSFSFQRLLSGCGIGSENDDSQDDPPDQPGCSLTRGRGRPWPAWTPHPAPHRSWRWGPAMFT
jgi:hypothetical protein